MARTTDTRERVAEIADKIAAEGGTPTPTLVRKMLGRGSPNTIVDALRDWSAKREKSPAPAKANTAAAMEMLGLQELAGLLRSTADTNAQLRDQVLGVVDASKQVSQLIAQLSELQDTCRSLSSQLQNDRAWMQSELEKNGERFAAVQKRMLLSIDEAREDARKWKEIATQAKDEVSTWKTTMSQRANAKNDEIARLTAQLEVFTTYFGHLLPDEVKVQLGLEVGTD